MAAVKNLTPKQIKKVASLLKTGEKLVEVTVAIRFVTTKDLEAASAEVLAHTDKFNPNERVDGYVNAKVLAGLGL
jgi:hypothetical protein